MIRVTAAEVRFTDHARERIAERANGLGEEQLRQAVLDRLFSGDYIVAVSASRLFVTVDGLSVVLALDEGPPLAVTVHELEERS